jgi:hypothetical protein
VPPEIRVTNQLASRNALDLGNFWSVLRAFCRQPPHTAQRGPMECTQSSVLLKKHGNGIHPPICFLFKCVS